MVELIFTLGFFAGGVAGIAATLLFMTMFGKSIAVKITRMETEEGDGFRREEFDFNKPVKEKEGEHVRA